MGELSELLDAALGARVQMPGLLDGGHRQAARLFNGFTEGYPELSLEVYGTTLVVFDHATPGAGGPAVRTALEVARARLPWLQAALVKARQAASTEERNGSVVWGPERQVARRVVEDGVSYRVHLTLNRDTSLYLDTRGLRAWLKANTAGQRVLNTFAYTCSLGVAARGGGAAEVVHTDMKKAFLTVGKDSYALNGWPVKRADFVTGDFFEVAGALKRAGRLFDVVLVDPPLASTTAKGKVDLQQGFQRVLDKVRPLVAHEGTLVAVNNAVFVSGAEFEAQLEAACAGGYLERAGRVDVPADVVGLLPGRPSLQVDAAPYNHSTKVALLKVRRKDGKR